MSVGMPAYIKLQEFGSQVWEAFGEPAYHVGSSLTQKRDWRDVDVRLILSDEAYEAWGFGKPGEEHRNGKWRAICWAFSELGRAMTGLPIDFQIQQQSWANDVYEGRELFPRSAIGLVPLRYKETQA